MLAWKVSLSELLPQAARAEQHNSIVPRRMFASSCFAFPSLAEGLDRRHFDRIKDAEFMLPERVSAQAPRMRVHRHRTITYEAAKGQARRPRQVDGERAGGGDARDDGNLRGGGLLHHLEARPAAHQEHRGLSPGDLPLEDQRAHDLVERVVAADVLEGRQGSQLRVERCRRVDAARAREIWLEAPELLHRRRDRRRLQHGTVGQRRAAVDDVLHAAPAAGATSMVFPKPSWSGLPQWATRDTSSREAITPSAKRNPMASSRSWPGVRMVTARVSPAARISSGSSTTTSSSAAGCATPPAMRRTSRRPTPLTTLFTTPSSSACPHRPPRP